MVLVKVALPDADVQERSRAHCAVLDALAGVPLEAALRSQPPAPKEQKLYGPYGWLNGHRALSEDSWELENDPLENNEEYFAIPLYSLTDPFKEIGRTEPAPKEPAPGVTGASE